MPIMVTAEDICAGNVIPDSGIPLFPPLSLQVQVELDRILSSPAFKSSNRCQQFLQHIVTYRNEPSELKERTIGVAVFGRRADYDTGSDAIVRVKATEVRKRLAQYNASSDPSRDVIIELNPGSYIPKITRRTEPSPVQSSAWPSTVTSEKTVPFWMRLHRGYIMAGICVVILLTVGAFRVHSVQASPGKKFLRPFVSRDEPIICISHPNTYNLTPATMKNKGDAPEAVHLRETLEHLGRSSRLSVADDISTTDLARSPLIILGGPRHNRLTLSLTENLRFTFQMIDNQPSIVDREHPDRRWHLPITQEKGSYVDYVVVTRLAKTKSANPVLCIAGLNAVGTRNAARTLFDTAFLANLLKDAPENWDQENLQFVLRVVEQQTGPTTVELRAATYWR